MTDASSSRTARNTCPACGASVPAGATRCPYCDTWLVPPGQRGPARELEIKLPSLPGKGRPLPRWGLSTQLVLPLYFLSLPVSFVGWLLEYPRGYWVRDSAVAAWCGLLPLWTLLVGLLWRGRAGFRAGIGLVLLVGLPFLAMVAHRAGHLNDDALGITALVAGCALGGFLLGRLGNYLLRLRLAARARRDAP